MYWQYILEPWQVNCVFGCGPIIDYNRLFLLCSLPNVTTDSIIFISVICNLKGKEEKNRAEFGSSW